MSYNFGTHRKSKKKFYFIIGAIVLLIWILVALVGLSVKQREVTKTINIHVGSPQ